jgi:hypothetical protein
MEFPIMCSPVSQWYAAGMQHGQCEKGKRKEHGRQASVRIACSYCFVSAPVRGAEGKPLSCVSLYFE